MNNNFLLSNTIRNLPFAALLIIALWLCENFFGLFSVSRVRFVIYTILFVILYKKNTTYSKPILLLFISMWGSILSCKIYHNQGIIDTITGYSTFGAIAIYFVLLKLRMPTYKIEKLLFWMFLAFSACYFYQMLVYPKPVFIGSDNPYQEELDMIIRRIRMPGMSIVGLGLFYSLNKVILGKIKYLPFVILAVILLLLFGFRTLLGVGLLFSFVMLIRINGFSWKLLFGFLLLIGIIYLFSLSPFGQEIFDQMSDRQNDMDQNFGNKDYIRYTTLFYYLQEHFKDPLEFFMGSGIPLRGSGSNYELYYTRLESFGIHYYDWGILGMSWMMGFLSLISMIWYSIKASITKLPNDKIYLSIWFGYLLFSGFTSAEFVRQGCFLIQGMALYMIFITTYEKNNISK